MVSSAQSGEHRRTRHWWPYPGQGGVWLFMTQVHSDKPAPHTSTPGWRSMDTPEYLWAELDSGTHEYPESRDRALIVTVP